MEGGMDGWREKNKEDGVFEGDKTHAKWLKSWFGCICPTRP
jgi:hypothetical protein